MALTAAQIETELALIRSQILALTAQATSSYSHQGRQVVMETARGKLEVLYKREAQLQAQLDRINAGANGTSGIRVRYGVPLR